MTGEEYAWLSQNHVKATCVMDNDYYNTHEYLVRETVELLSKTGGPHAATYCLL